MEGDLRDAEVLHVAQDEHEQARGRVDCYAEVVGAAVCEGVFLGVGGGVEGGVEERVFLEGEAGCFYDEGEVGEFFGCCFLRGVEAVEAFAGCGYGAHVGAGGV